MFYQESNSRESHLYSAQHDECFLRLCSEVALLHRRLPAPAPSSALLLVPGSICPRRPRHYRCRTSRFLKPCAEGHQFLLLPLKSGSRFGDQPSGERDYVIFSFVYDFGFGLIWFYLFSSHPSPPPSLHTHLPECLASC